MTDDSDDELVRRALDGLFDIACEDRPSAVTDSLHDQIDDLPADRCRALVEEMVDTDRLEDLVRKEAQKAADRPAGPSAGPGEKVDQVLEPLVRWRLGEEGERALAGMPETERMHVLFSSLGRR